MRITNTMMMNQTLRNVSKSKNNLNTSENELATEKKITRPSDDPIVAIRALSLSIVTRVHRTSLQPTTEVPL